jgi:hypothetical protein
MRKCVQEFWDSHPEDVRVKKQKLGQILSSIEQGAFDECFEGKSAKGLQDPKFKGNFHTDTSMRPLEY